MASASSRSGEAMRARASSFSEIRTPADLATPRCSHGFSPIFLIDMGSIPKKSVLAPNALPGIAHVGTNRLKPSFSPGGCDGRPTVYIKRFVTAALLVGALVVSGCANTIRGAGQDAANTVNATEGAVKGVANAAQ